MFQIIVYVRDGASRCEKPFKTRREASAFAAWMFSGLQWEVIAI